MLILFQYIALFPTYISQDIVVASNKLRRNLGAVDAHAISVNPHTVANCSLYLRTIYMFFSCQRQSFGQYTHPKPRDFTGRETNLGLPHGQSQVPLRVRQVRLHWPISAVQTGPGHAWLVGAGQVHRVLRSGRSRCQSNFLPWSKVQGRPRWFSQILDLRMYAFMRHLCEFKPDTNYYSVIFC